MLVGSCSSELSGHRLQGELKKVTASQDDDFVGVLKKNIPNKLAFIKLRPWAKFSKIQPSLRDLFCIR